MTIDFILTSDSAALLARVGEFSRGLGWAVDTRTGPRLRLQLPSNSGLDVFLHFLNQVALTATTLGVDLGEPACRVQYREAHASVEVTLDFRLADINLRAASAGADG
jgi:hypothetical protein